MTKKEFIALLSEKIDRPKTTTYEIVDIFLETVEETLLAGEMVQITGWGTFEVDTKARLGRNPKTGTEVTIPPRRVVKFRPGKQLASKIDN